MGIRFRKSFSLAPGVKLNVGKKSAGISVGGKYGGVSANTRTGARTRISAPGTGVSYSTKIGSSSSKKSKSYKDDVDIPELNINSGNSSGSHSGKRPKKSPKKKWYQKTWFIILMLVIFFPVGLFLLWKCTKLKKPLKFLITALVGLIFIFANSSVLENITLEIPDYQEEYFTNSHIDTNIFTEPEDFLSESNLDDLEFITSSDNISFDKDGIYTGEVAGTYEVFVKLGSTESNTVFIHVVEQKDIPDDTSDAVSEEPEKVVPTESENEVKEETIPAAPIIQETSTEVSENVENEDVMVWVDNSAKRYHKKNGCGMDNPYQVTLDQAIAMGKTPCKRCYK